MQNESEFELDPVLRKKSVTNYAKIRKEPIAHPEHANQQIKRRNSSVIEDDFDLIDFNEEIKSLHKQQMNQHNNPVVSNAGKFEYEDGTFAMANREYSIVDIDKKTVNSIPNQAVEETKEKKPNRGWTNIMKEKFSNFMYKVNHNADYLSQYGKLDFKNWERNPIQLIWGNRFSKNNWKDELYELFNNIILFTYRKDFINPLESVNKKTGKPKKLNSDFGWGCMIRWGQMMLANSILIHLKRTIFNSDNGLIKLEDLEKMHVTKDLENEVISKFLDTKWGQDAPFSIKEITDQGLEIFHKVAGDWYGTNSISQVIKQLNQKYRPYDDFEIWVFNDGILFKSEVIKLGTEIFTPKKVNFSYESSENSSEEDQCDGYFDQTRGKGNQSGGSENAKEYIVISKPQHSGGNKEPISTNHDEEERIQMGTWSFSNEDVFMYEDQRRKWSKWVLVIINTRLGLK